MDRTASQMLIAWKNSDSRKSLLVRGARQVGKTWIVRRFGKEFDCFLEVNLDAQRSVHGFFDGDIDPAAICSKLSAFYDIPVEAGKTLLFLDEIQACPNAIRALRYFHERLPSLHVIAAGSLIEFALQQLPSFGVGRISSLYLYPMSFREFTAALAGPGLAAQVDPVDGRRPVDAAFHNRLLDIFRIYCMIGGMPAVVELYRRHRDIRKCQTVLDDLLSTFRDDFAKYRARIPLVRLTETFDSVMRQAGGKFTYSQVNRHEPLAQAKQALDLLCMASLTHKVYHTAAHGVPIGSQVNAAKFKVIPFDVGIMQRVLCLDPAETLILDSKELVNRGHLAEVFAGLEMCAGSPPHIKAQLYYWHREARASNAEVDYIVQNRDMILPVEVKSGRRGSMQSMYRFLDEHESPAGIRLSSEAGGRFGRIIIVPVYAAGRIVEDNFPVLSIVQNDT